MSCQIVLDNYQSQYYVAGSVIQGRVICMFDKQIETKGVFVKFKGKEHNKWTQRSSNETTFYSGKNKFLRVELPLHPAAYLGPGTLEYPFTFTLPPRAPSSYKGHFGGITYSLDAKVDIPLRFNYKSKVELNVFRPVNLNDPIYRQYLVPYSYSESKTMCCWCCASRPVTVEVHLDKHVFVIGETAKVRVNVRNNSSTDVEAVKVKLGTLVTCKVTRPSNRNRRYFEPLASMEDTGVAAGGERSYCFDLVVPRAAKVINFEDRVLFHQRTTITAKAVFKNHVNLRVPAQVVIGHIPRGSSEIVWPYFDRF
ncbi:hypothetical protein NQ315_007386 [Exocentrus adspersus]|uniref:Arrestin C-terminal-like domain-containing protein n=1 Tax=Exocentrus adspersus TaxID=1586481 RepID=A0AAV8VHN0_9CUCU|nr:hypothetical protein NQ315_007386 [Exocentrus adspersus]